jgi:hypothetical protein
MSPLRAQLRTRVRQVERELRRAQEGRFFMMFSSTTLRRIGVAAIVSLALASAAIPGAAQMRAQMADKIAVNAAHQLVTKINGQSCSEFGSMMSEMKQGKSSGSSSSSMSSKLKGNSQARSDFVNIVAGPLMNKMIDCNMLPGGM